MEDDGAHPLPTEDRKPGDVSRFNVGKSAGVWLFWSVKQCAEVPNPLKNLTCSIGEVERHVIGLVLTTFWLQHVVMDILTLDEASSIWETRGTPLPHLLQTRMLSLEDVTPAC